MQHRVEEEQRQHNDGDQILHELEQHVEQLDEKAPDGRMQDRLFVGAEKVMIAHALEMVLLIVHAHFLRLDVDGDPFLVEIDKAEIQIHLKGQIIVLCFPEQQIEPIGIHAREIALARGGDHILQHQRDTPVLFSVRKIQCQLRFGNKMRVDCFVRDGSLDVQRQGVILDQQLFDFNMVFHKKTPQLPVTSYLTNSVILATASSSASPF